MDTVQEFHLELLKNVQFENIRGEKIVADLLAHPGLWSAVFVEIKLRIEPGEAPDQFWRLECLYLFTVPGREEELRSLAESWHPVEIHFTCEDDHWKETAEEPFTTNDQDVLDNEKLYLELWWKQSPRLPAGGSPAYPAISNAEG
jgi:hypothetical protein